MQSATLKNDPSAGSQPADVPAAPTGKKTRLSVLLITGDDTLWPQVGAGLGSEFVLKQVDSIDELLTSMPPGQPGIILWDARGQPDAPAALARLQLHSPCFAVVALDEAAAGDTWKGPISLRQVVAHVAVPVPAASLKAALDNAQEEVNVRTALLGSGTPTASPGRGSGAMGSEPGGARRIPWMPVSITLGALIVFGGTFVAMRHNGSAVQPAPSAGPAAAPQTGKPAPPTAEKADLLVEKAQQAMLDRRFIEPADGSALTLYRRALEIDPGNGEASQGLQRLAGVLIARAQSALDDRKFDVASQALETARSIDASDSRLAALDERMASIRAELGPAQIAAAINAQNFDRAAQLIDEAARAKSVNNARLGQLRDELHRKRQETDIANFLKLADTRLQQDKVIEPRNDSAAYYLAQARGAGASAAQLQAPSQEISKRLVQTVRAAIDQRRFTDADRVLADLHGYGVPASAVASLQHDLSAARNQAAAPPPEQRYAELTESRLAQGKVAEPENDSALFYLAQMRTADPKNSALPRLSNAVEVQLLAQARAALDAAQPAKAEGLLQLAAGLGASPDLSALGQRLAQLKQTAAATMPEVKEADLTRLKGIEIDYPIEAQRKNVEGWVDLSYVVTAEGKVTAVKVLNATPAHVFEAAATRSVLRVRYRPMMQAGKAVAVGTKLRIAFRMPK